LQPRQPDRARRHPARSALEPVREVFSDRHRQPRRGEAPLHPGRTEAVTVAVTRGPTVCARPAAGSGLTTTKTPFIEEARASQLAFIHQPYELYSSENHATWGRLLERMQARWRQHASAPFLDGIERLRLSPARIPRLDEVNRFLEPLTGFRAHAVS